MLSKYRIGFGFDSHPLRKNRKLIIGGVEIPFSYGLFGHSDADVLCHSIGDALLGAVGLNDIGCYFPDTDPKLRGISSLKILAQIMKLIEKNRYRIINVDSVVICQKPKLNPYFEQMKMKLAEVLKVDKSAIGIKAKTTEGLGFTNKQQGIIAYSLALLRKK
ncbi:MAG: 2-C-methyl-D-erythritol 2,4-cyclodiphosphate synthase [candidate division WOR-3 bacterium]|nr:2-C-methyl-D-erythritol 2,4-cyclodiphosphate synthase [candidate division WOR-3 bacterium]